MTLAQGIPDTESTQDSRAVTGRFRKRPIEVVATRWWVNGDHPDDGVGQDAIDPASGDTYKRIEGAVVGFFRHPNVPGTKACEHCGRTMHDHGWIDTLEGGQIVCPGDWVVTGVEGERYPVKPGIFDKTFEAV
jgi:hypothetical protein